MIDTFGGIGAVAMSGPYSARDVANHIVQRRKSKNDAVTPLQLMKLVFLCHGWMLAKYGRPLVLDTFDTWRYGPVAPALYNAIRKFGSSPVVEVSGAKAIEPDAQEMDVLNVIADYYAKFDGIRLSSLTHSPGSPWDITMKSVGQNEAIPNDLIENYYRKLMTGVAASGEAATAALA